MSTYYIIDHLYRIKFIGYFPNGIEVLLVSLPIALEEAKVVDPELTLSFFKGILKKHNIFIFNSLEEYVKFKTPQKTRKESYLYE